MKKKILLLILGSVLAVNSFALPVKLFNAGVRAKVDLYPGIKTTIANSKEVEGATGIGFKGEVFFKSLGVGAGYISQNNKVKFAIGEKNIKTTATPLYVSLKSPTSLLNVKLPVPYIKANLGYAFVTQSGEGVSEKKDGVFAGAYVGMELFGLYGELGAERIGTNGRAFVTGIGYSLEF